MRLLSLGPSAYAASAAYNAQKPVKKAPSALLPPSSAMSFCEPPKRSNSLLRLLRDSSTFCTSSLLAHCGGGRENSLGASAPQRSPRLNSFYSPKLALKFSRQGRGGIAPPRCCFNCSGHLQVATAWELSNSSPSVGVQHCWTSARQKPRPWSGRLSCRFPPLVTTNPPRPSGQAISTSPFGEDDLIPPTG